jgi:integrase
MASIAPTRRTSDGKPARDTRWRARYRDPEGRSRSRTFARKTDAQRFLDEASTSIAHGAWVAPEGPKTPFCEWVGTYLETVMDLRESTLSIYARELRHAEDRFGATPIGTLRPLAIQEWLRTLLDGGVPPSSVHRRYRVLRRVLGVAVDAGMLVRNPCDGVRPPQVPTAEMRFLTADELEALVQALGPWYQTFVYTAGYLGLRFGELVGLKRKRVDVLRRRVTVAEQLTRVDNRLVWSEPKTKAGTRAVSVPAFLADLLAEQLSDRALPGPDGLVFPNKAGNPIIGPSFSGNVFKPAVQRAGLAPLRFHDLRHTAVALAIAEGAHPKAIQVRMGHASVRVTLDLYGHLFPELDEAIASGLNARYWRARQQDEPAALRPAG